MSKNYEQTAKDIVRLIGGNENIESMHHCQTRLRFKLYDEAKADKEAIEKLEGVMKVMIQGGMFQVVVGMDVQNYYDEVEKLVTVKADAGDAAESAEDDNRGIFRKGFDTVADFISSIFSPIVPALAGAGMVKALLALLVAFNLIDKTGMNYTILNMFGDATFAFLPMLLAFTTAKKLNSNPILGAVTAGIMCHATWTGLVTAGEAVSFFGIPLYLVKYTNSCIPIVLVMLVQAWLEKRLNKIIPKSVRLVFVPMIEFIVMGTLALALIGPIGDYVGTVFTAAFTFLSENVSWAEAMLMGCLYSPLVIFGLHHGLAPLGTMQMAQMGYDGVFGPGVLCANIGQGTAALVAGLISKKNETRQIGISAGITGLMGTTEPALYGINVPKKYPLIAGMIGGGFGGLYAGLTHCHRFATGSSGLPAVVMYIGDDTMTYFYNIIIALVITIAVSAIATVALSLRFEKKEQEEDNTNKIEENTAAVEETAQITAETVLTAPLQGKVLPLTEAADEVFASEALGKGVIIEPKSEVLKAPMDAKVITLFPTGHAIGLEANGVELLIHIGIDTVEMNGKGFTAFVKEGDTVKCGQDLIRFDREEIKKAGYSDQVMVIVTNADDFAEIKTNTGFTANGTEEILRTNR